MIAKGLSTGFYGACGATSVRGIARPIGLSRPHTLGIMERSVGSGTIRAPPGFSSQEPDPGPRVDVTAAGREPAAAPRSGREAQRRSISFSVREHEQIQGFPQRALGRHGALHARTGPGLRAQTALQTMLIGIVQHALIRDDDEFSPSPAGIAGSEPAGCGRDPHRSREEPGHRCRRAGSP